MKTSKKYLAILLTLCTLLCSIISYSVHAVTVEKETPISADADMGNEGELMPMAANGCTYDYNTFHDLLDAYSISYSGSANHTTLQDGYSYTYTKSGDYWSIYLEGPNGAIGLFRVGSM